ncbi:MAG: hypothetical protein HKN26_06320 [Acidimicrobiales bacterium]|nr:hypothetical protein [Acidimicrobiales bacterium]
MSDHPNPAAPVVMLLTALFIGMALLLGGCASDSSSTTTTSVVPTESPAPRVTPTPFNPSSDERPGVPTTPSRYRVAIYGDSMAHSIQEQLVENLDAGGRLDTSIRIFAGAALCDYLDDIEADADPAAEGAPLWGAIIMFSNNTFTPCMADTTGAPLTGDAAFEKFRSDLRTAVSTLSEAGVHVWIPTVPITRAIDEGADDHLTPINDAAAAIAADFANALAVDAAAAVLNTDGSYAETLPCLPLEPCTGGTDTAGQGFNFVRETDGVHFCTSGYPEGADILPGTCPAYSSGAFRYASAITAPVITQAASDWAIEAEN